MRFPPAFLDAVRDRILISSIVGRGVSWDRRKSNPGKGDWWACCPFHGEKSASFHVDDHKGRYHCFGCKVSGDIFTYLVEKNGMGFPEAVEMLAAEAGLALPQMSEQDQQLAQNRAGLHEIMEMAAQFFEAALNTTGGRAARTYLQNRSLTPDIIREFRIGYGPADRQALRRHLIGKGVSADHMVEAGLVIQGEGQGVPYDRFRDRVMFPVCDGRGRVIAFGGRALASDPQAKYLNSPETPLFHKGAVLYNLHKARAPAHTRGSVIVVEGYMDVIALHRAGLPHAVAPLGTALTDDQMTALWRVAAEPILMFDGDGAGLKAAWRALDLALVRLKPGYSVRLAFLPDGQDPDDLLGAQGPQALVTLAAGAQPLSDVLWNRALSQNDRGTPERSARFEADVRALVGQIADERVRVHYEADFTRRLKALWGDAAVDLRGSAVQAGSRQAFVPRAKARTGPATPARSWKDRKPWDVHLPASRGLRTLASRDSPGDLARKREQAMVLTLINHPGLVDAVMEEFAALEFLSSDIDSLRRDVLNAMATHPGLDSPGLRAHLHATGHGLVLDRLDTEASRLKEWFLGSEAASADARIGLAQMAALHRKHVTLVRELQAAEMAFAAQPTQERLLELDDIREQLRSGLGVEAAIEGFGLASGRPPPAVS